MGGGWDSEYGGASWKVRLLLACLGCTWLWRANRRPGGLYHAPGRGGGQGGEAWRVLSPGRLAGARPALQTVQRASCTQLAATAAAAYSRVAALAAALWQPAHLACRRKRKEQELPTRRFVAGCTPCAGAVPPGPGKRLHPGCPARVCARTGLLVPPGVQGVHVQHRPPTTAARRGCSARSRLAPAATYSLPSPLPTIVGLLDDWLLPAAGRCRCRLVSVVVHFLNDHGRPGPVLLRGLHVVATPM